MIPPPSPNTSASEYDELLILLRYHLPSNIKTIWINPIQINALLVTGGIKSLPPKFVANALRSNRNNDQSFLEKNNYQKTNYYCFDPINKKYNTPKDQLVALKAASSEAEKESIQPTIPSNHFLTFAELIHLRKYTATNSTKSTQSNNTTRSPINSTNTNTNKSTPTSTNPLNSAYYLQTRRGGCGCAANNSTTCASHIVTPETNNNNNTNTIPHTNNNNTTQRPNNTNVNRQSKKKISLVPTESSSGAPVGIVLMDIKSMDDFHKKVLEPHARTCRAGSLEVVKQEKVGYELIRTYSCGFCKMTYDMSTGPEEDADSSVKKKRGGQMRPINKIVSSSLFKSGVVTKQVQEAFVESGIICPSDTGLYKMINNVKEVVEYVSDEQLKKNRKEHVAAVRKIPGYRGDHVFTDSYGKEHSVSVGAAAVDGNGEKRAYNHIITGDQHATVIISLVTGEPLYVWHDQISCIHCQRKLTALLNDTSSKVLAQDITAYQTVIPIPTNNIYQ